MCEHDKLILQKLESIEELAATTREVAEAQINALKDQVTTHTEFTKDKLLTMEKFTKDKLETMETHHREEFEYVKSELGVIKKETKLTNSRVTHVEHNQENCIVKELGTKFENYQQKMRPIYMIATSWKMIVGIAVVFGVVMTLGQALIELFYKLIGINMPG